MPTKQMMVRKEAGTPDQSEAWDRSASSLSPAEGHQRRPGPRLEGAAGVLRGASVRGGVHRSGALRPAEGRQRGGHEDPGEFTEEPGGLRAI